MKRFEDFRIQDVVTHLEGGAATGVRIHLNAVANGADRVHGHMLVNLPPGWSVEELRREMVAMLANMERGFAEEKDRAEYARLRAKYEGGDELNDMDATGSEVPPMHDGPEYGVGDGIHYR